MVSQSRLREIINEELQRRLLEQVDHEGVRTVVNAASKLLKSAESFKDDSTGAMANAVTPHLDALIKVLENMVNAPASYVDRPVSVPKTVKLRQVKGGVV